MKSALLSFLQQVRPDKRLLSFDEATTKQIVLLKILSLLGWDVFNVDEVKPEYAVGSQRVDYALRCSNKNKAFIEVKKVGEDLEKHQDQLLNYSFKEGVKLAVLSNGVNWRFYLPLHEGSWEQRKFYTIDVYDQDPNEVADRFIDFLSRGNIVSEKAIQNAEATFESRQKADLIRESMPKAWDKLLSEPDELLVDLVAEATEKICGYKPTNTDVEVFICSVMSARPATRRGPESVASRPPPEASSFEGEGDHVGKGRAVYHVFGKRYEVKYWIEVLTGICGLLCLQNPSQFERVLELRGTKRPYFSRNPDALRAPQLTKRDGIWMETNLSAKQIVEISRHVFSVFGYSASELQIDAL